MCVSIKCTYVCKGIHREVKNRVEKKRRRRRRRGLRVFDRRVTGEMMIHIKQKTKHCVTLVETRVEEFQLCWYTTQSSRRYLYEFKLFSCTHS